MTRDSKLVRGYAERVGPKKPTFELKCQESAAVPFGGEALIGALTALAPVLNPHQSSRSPAALSNRSEELPDQHTDDADGHDREEGDIGVNVSNTDRKRSMHSPGYLLQRAKYPHSGGFRPSRNTRVIKALRFTCAQETGKYWQATRI